MSKPLPSVLVVIVNYRTPKLVVDCLRSLEPQIKDHGEAAVVIVDNASGDDSVKVLSTAITTCGWQSWASLHPAPTNGGFAYGNNQAIDSAMKSNKPPELFWLLNPDTVARPGALRALTEFMAANTEVSICGGGIEEADGNQWPFAFRFHGILSEVERGCAFGPISRLLSRWTVARRMGAEPTRVDWVSGATMMVRRQAVETIGLMDEGYFLYFEEADYCLQAHRAGLECWYLPHSRIMHIAGQSTGVTSKSDKPSRLPAYWFESRGRYFAKNYGRLYAACSDVAWMLSFCLGSLRRWLQRKPSSSPPRLLTDFLRHSSLWHSHATGKAKSTRPSAPRGQGAA